MSVRAALIGASRGRNIRITVAEARWMARLANAVPDILADRMSYRGIDKDGQPIGDPISPYWGTRTLWEWALDYVDAEQAGDLDRLDELDGVVAMLYAAKGRHFPEAMRRDDES